MAPHNIGRYEIKSEIGRGGMATVYRAYDPHFRRDVAVKLLPREFLHDPTFRTRFKREAQTIAALEHSAIVPVYDFGEEDGQPYLVMRFLSGGTLTHRLEQGALPLAETIRIVNRLAPALDEAHEQGIIHRDLKPDNILFDHRNDPFITDFGIVKLSEGSETITTGNAIIGTPAYMSPEQARGEARLDGRSDIYALGVILFEMLAGKLPYEASTPIGLIMKHINEPVPRLLELKPNLPPGCETVITRAMAKEPYARYGTATALAIALTTSASAKSVKLSPIVGSTNPPPPLKQQQVIPGQSPTPIPARKTETLACPSCGAPLSGDFAPNQQIECASCGSFLMLSDLEADETIVCPQCHTPNPGHLRFCSHCDHQLKVDCVRCHTPNRFDAPYCANCGVNLEQARAMRRELLEARQRSQAEREQAFREKEARQRQEKLRNLLNDLNDPVKHTFAIYQLTQLGSEAVKPLIQTLLTAGNPHARSGSADTLGQICEQQEIKPLIKARAAKALIKALADTEPNVRYQAAKALGKFKGQPGQLAVEPLAALLKDPHEEVRLQARRSLQKIGGKRAQEILNKPKGLMGWIKGS